MTPSEPTPRQTRAESTLAFGIMFFAMALLCLMLGWADGVRHGRAYHHFPHSGGWFVATAMLGALGVIFFVWSRSAKRR
jgi:putative Mn2+ efflux pump MntP